MNTRLIAARVLEQVLGQHKTLTMALDDVLPSIHKENDRAFVQALCYGVCRWYFLLDAQLSALTQKPIKDMQIRLLALIGLYQLRFTRVKPHAAVAETVSAAQRKAWAKPLLNALLRTCQRELTEREQNPEAETTPQHHAHPEWLAAAIRDAWPEQADSILLANNQLPPLVLRVNLSRLTRDDYLKKLEDAELKASPSADCPTAVILDQPVPVSRLPGFAEGWVSVQDSAAQFAAGLLELQAGQRVLDVCAAPGGKTLHILESCPELAQLVALDSIAARVTRINENLKRGGYTAEVITGDARQTADWWNGALFDRILLDAPCSATGVIRRHPDIKLLRTPEDLEELPLLQAEILEAIWPLLAPGGFLVYATCSILPRENRLQLDEFIARHPDVEVQHLNLPHAIPAGHGVQILPGESGMDGFYYAKLKKTA
ncbi:MAG: 16S rRNA (cytosine(967)-C(5))-methyltransferase RsmB [Methylococcaceae bacterium]